MSFVFFSLLYPQPYPEGPFVFNCAMDADNSKDSNSNLLFLARVSGKGPSVSQRVLRLPIFSLFSCCFPPRAAWVAQDCAIVWEAKTLKLFIYINVAGKGRIWGLESIREESPGKGNALILYVMTSISSGLTPKNVRTELGYKPPPKSQSGIYIGKAQRSIAKALQTELKL